MNLISTGLNHYIELDNGDTVKISYSTYIKLLDGTELDESMTDCPFCDEPIANRILLVFDYMGEDAKGFHDQLVH